MASKKQIAEPERVPLVWGVDTEEMLRLEKSAEYMHLKARQDTADRGYAEAQRAYHAENDAIKRELRRLFSKPNPTILPLSPVS